jgi:hypothetical protein
MRRRDEHVGAAFGQHVPTDAAQQQVCGGRLAVFGEHDEVAALLLLVLDDALRRVAFDARLRAELARVKMERDILG